MAEILALVLQHDEHDVLAAVEMALEAGVPTKTHVARIFCIAWWMTDPLQRLT